MAINPVEDVMIPDTTVGAQYEFRSKGEEAFACHGGHSVIEAGNEGTARSLIKRVQDTGLYTSRSFKS